MDKMENEVLDRVASAWRQGYLGEGFNSPSASERETLRKLHNENILKIHEEESYIGANPGERFDEFRARGLEVDLSDN